MIVWVAIAFGVGFLGGCQHEKHVFDEYKATVNATAEAQKREAEKIDQRNQQKAKEIQSDYEKRIAAIRRAYSGMHYAGPGSMPSTGKAANGIDARPTYDVLAESCAETTQQLVELQQFIKETQ